MTQTLLEVQLRVHKHIATLRALDRLLVSFHEPIDEKNLERIIRFVDSEQVKELRGLLHKMSLTVLEDMSYADLRAKARKKQVSGFSRMNRVELINGLRNLEKDEQRLRDAV